MTPHATTDDDGVFYTYGSIEDFTKPHSEFLANLPERAPLTNIKILIVGGGTAGLLMAMESWRKGHNVTRILERSKAPMFTGDGIFLQPSGTKIFKHWPAIRKDLTDYGFDAPMDYYRHTGEHIYGPVPAPATDPRYYKPAPGEVVPPIGTSRIRFYQALLRQVAAIGIPIEWNVKATEFFEDIEAKKGGIRTEAGQTYMADVCVASDGLKTKSNICVRGVEDKVVPSGWSIYRTGFPTSLAFRDPAVKARWDLSKGDYFDFFLGSSFHVTVAVNKELVMWGVNHHDSAVPDSKADENWTPNVDPEDVIAFLDSTNPEWDPQIKALIRQTPANSIVHWRLNWRDLQRQWTSPGGHVVQIGDAAHAFLPTSGNGGTQGLEDGACLAACLQLSGGPAMAPIATKIFNTLRYERISCIQKGMFVNNQLKVAPDWTEIMAKPHTVHFAMNTWAYKHDPEAYAYDKYGAAFNALVNGGPGLQNNNYPPGHKFKPWTLDQVKKDLASGAKLGDLLDGDWS